MGGVSPVGRRGIGILAVGALISSLLATGTLNATEVAASSTLIVNSAADTVDPSDGVLTLREAITEANTGNGYTITFSLPDPATITLTSSLPEIKTSVTISGPGEASLTIDSGTFRPFSIKGGSTTINTTITDLSLTGTPPAIAFFGSLIHNTKATTILQRITVENVTMTGSAWESLIYNKESNSFLTIRDSTFNGNSADDSSYLIQANHGSTDSGLAADNVVTIERSTFVDNLDFVVLQAQRTMLVSDSTFVRNYQAVSFIGSGNHVFDNNRVEANSQGAQINPWKNDSRGWFFHNTVTDNQFINNGGYGLSTSVVAPASATITGNTFGGNAPDLIYNGSSTVPAGIAATNTFTASTFTLTYDGNGSTGGTVPVDGVSYSGGATATVANPGPLVRAGYDFVNWNTAPDGSGTTAAPGSSMTINANVILYAQWRLSPAPPTIPASAPMTVTVSAGDDSALVSWSPPQSNGSFPITHYEVSTQPRAASCVVPAEVMQCELSGVRNGTEYEVRVRALTGAGWGSWSEPMSVTPQPAQDAASIVITGSRNGAMVQVAGQVTGMDLGEVTVMVRWPGQRVYSPVRTLKVDRSEGDLLWQRRTKKKVYVYFQTTDLPGERVRSNRVIIPRMA